MDSGTPPMDINKQIVVNVRDQNDPPYDVQLSSSDVIENATANTLVGTFGAQDEDNSQMLTFTLIDDDAGNFRIDTSANLYKTRTSNYESINAHFVVVQVQDNGSPQKKVIKTLFMKTIFDSIKRISSPSHFPLFQVTKNFTINVIDVNEPPVEVLLQSKKRTQVNNTTLSVPEDVSPNSIIADVVIQDSDSISNLIIRLDNTYDDTFNINNSIASCSAVTGSSSKAKSKCVTSIRLNKALNFENRQSFNLTIRILDRGHSAVRKFTVDVIDTNDPPTDININGKKNVGLLENQKGITIGKLETTDEDVKQSFQYQIISNNFNLFEIQDENLVLGTYSQVNYEKQNVYHLNISSTDNGSPAKSVVKQIQIDVIDGNDPITKVSLTNYTVVENANVNSLVGFILTEDEDTSTNKTCISETGGFLRNDHQKVLVARPLNFETTPSFDYKITCVDGQISSNWTLSIKVIDVNEAPTSIKLSSSTIKENQMSMTLIGKLIVNDPDNLRQNRQSFNFSLQNYQDRFQIKNNELYASTSFDYETVKFIDLGIEVKDSGTPSLSFSEILTISIIDVNDKPTDMMVSFSCYLYFNFHSFNSLKNRDIILKVKF